MGTCAPATTLAAALATALAAALAAAHLTPPVPPAIRPPLARQIELLLYGIDGPSCSAALVERLAAAFPGADTFVQAASETGSHPNSVCVKGSGVDAKKVKAVIAALDAGRGKYTVANGLPPASPAARGYIASM